jgi:type IV pilus assembly protein PilB
VSAAVFGVVAQRLVRTICPKCKESYKPTADILEELNLTGTPAQYTLYRGKGCEHCHSQGYKGRTTLVELMVVDSELRHMIHKNASSFELREAAQKAGMVTLWRDGIEKALAGITTVDEVRKASFSEEE